MSRGGTPESSQIEPGIPSETQKPTQHSRLTIALQSDALPVSYLADRLDIDDPLRGYQIRDRKTGWIQG